MLDRTSSIFDSADPTGTSWLRQRFRAAGERQLNAARRLAYQALVERNFMRFRDPLQALLNSEPDPAERLFEFNAWFERVLQQTIGSVTWAIPHLQRAYLSGVQAGANLTGFGIVSATLPAAHQEQAFQDLRAIASAVHEQVMRAAYAASVAKLKPSILYQEVLRALRKAATQRLYAFANMAVVRLHNAGRLSSFAAAGISEVAVVPERMRGPPRPVRDHFHLDQPRNTTVNAMTAGDEKVCPVCQGIASGGPYSVARAEKLLPAHPNCRCVFVIVVGREVPYGVRGVEPGQQMVIKPVYQGKPISGEPPPPPKRGSLTAVEPERVARLAERTGTREGVKNFSRRIQRPEDFITAIANVPRSPNPSMLIRELIRLAKRRLWEYLIPAAWRR